MPSTGSPVRSASARPSSIESSPRSCSPTSSTRPLERPQVGDRAWSELVERHHAIVRTLLGRYRGVEVDTAGDGFFATFDGPARAVRCAEAIVDAVRPLGIEVRAGCHTGEVETIDGKVGGLAVNVGARVAALAGRRRSWSSSTVKDLTAGSGLVFADAGEHELKGVPDRVAAVPGGPLIALDQTVLIASNG